MVDQEIVFKRRNSVFVRLFHTIWPFRHSSVEDRQHFFKFAALSESDDEEQSEDENADFGYFCRLKFKIEGEREW